MISATRRATERGPCQRAKLDSVARSSRRVIVFTICSPSRQSCGSSTGLNPRGCGLGGANRACRHSGRGGASAAPLTGDAGLRKNDGGGDDLAERGGGYPSAGGERSETSLFLFKKLLMRRRAGGGDLTRRERPRNSTDAAAREHGRADANGTSLCRLHNCGFFRRRHLLLIFAPPCSLWRAWRARREWFLPTRAWVGPAAMVCRFERVRVGGCRWNTRPKETSSFTANPALISTRTLFAYLGRASGFSKRVLKVPSRFAWVLQHHGD